jgi:glycosyltransferase involved in cell wall biosynthesis
MSKVRICHVNTRFLRGGGTKNTLFTIAGLDKSRYEVDLIVGREVYSPQVETLEGVNLMIVQSMIRNINPILDLKALITLYKIFRRNKYHVVHTHIAKAGILGRIAAKMAGVPIIVHSLHGSTFHSLLHPLICEIYILLEKLTGQFTDYFVPVGEDLKNRYLEQGIGCPAKYQVIHSGMDLSKFFAAGNLAEPVIQSKKRELGLEPDHIVIGMVCSLEPRKGYTYFFEAARRLATTYPKVRFLCVGEGFYREELEKKVSCNNLEDQVIFTGYRTDIAEVMATFDILVLTSLWEGLPQVLVQGVAVGKPIVTFDVEGAREVVKNGLNGFVVPLKDVSSLVQKLDYLLLDLEQARAMGRAGKTLIDDSWSVETMVRQTDALYQRLLHEYGIL